MSPKFRQLHNFQRQQRVQEQRQLQEQLRRNQYNRQLHPSRAHGTLPSIHPHQVFREYIFNCSNIHDIKIVRKVGHGVSKQTYLGTFRGMKVAVKMVTRHVSDIQSCLKRFKEQGDNTNSMKIREKCFVFPTMKLMKEILLLEQLSHPNLIKLLGFCVRSEETDTTDLSEHGIIAVHEFGEHFMIDNLRILPWQTRLKHARQLVSLLQYLENSPIGSLRISDFKETHFLLVNNDRIKMIDMDDIHNIEPKCSSYNRPTVGMIAKDMQAQLGRVENECEYSLPCRMALCLGFNAKFNLDRANALFFKRLLFPTSFPSNITRRLEELNVELDTLSISTSDLLHELESIQLIADEILKNIKRKNHVRNIFSVSLFGLHIGMAWSILVGHQQDIFLQDLAMMSLTLPV
ncbi:extracellular tyrosine-protein kinase PKDCC-like [Octopus vulgaris]|uniref:Extracellular tyrosine-protein kinase PKDCC-like n=1 Tax=Octopus vulgaris TaxID=6645 RepID=A0AA36FFH1_OCTVU|nr:extracellular tyrosine-protein kinase PKDCC-like [Octopus vulgaris]